MLFKLSWRASDVIKNYFMTESQLNFVWLVLSGQEASVEIKIKKRGTI